MPPSSESEAERSLELIILRALCQGTPEGSVRASAKRILGSYRWREPLHQAVFEVIMGMPKHDTRVIRDLLPARLTRRGFPDFNLPDFFGGRAVARKRVPARDPAQSQRSLLRASRCQRRLVERKRLTARRQRREAARALLLSALAAPLD